MEWLPHGSHDSQRAFSNARRGYKPPLHPHEPPLDFRLDSPTGMGDIYMHLASTMRISKYQTMKLIQTLVVVSLLAVFAAPVQRMQERHLANDKAEKEKAEKEKERAERKRVREAVEAFITPRDKNKDGSLTKEEFLSGETDKAAGEKKFNDANKNNDRALYKTEIQAMLGL